MASKKEYWDAYSIASTSYNKGLAKGLAEGETKGIAKGIAKGEAKGRAEAKAEARQEKLESARKMKARGFSADDIVEIIGITPEELDTLNIFNRTGRISSSPLQISHNYYKAHAVLKQNALS